MKERSSPKKQYISTYKSGYAEKEQPLHKIMKIQPQNHLLITHPSNIKTAFFQEEVYFMEKVKQFAQNLKSETKNILLCTHNKQKHVSNLNKQIKDLAKNIESEMIQTKIQEGRGMSEVQIQTAYIFDSYSNQIQELNQILLDRQKNVQKAEQIKREGNGQYYITNQISLKYDFFMKKIDKNIKGKEKLIKQVIQGIQLIINNIQSRKKASEHKLFKLLTYRRNSIGLKKQRQLNQMQKYRGCKSLDKHIAQSKIKKNRNEFLILKSFLSSKTTHGYVQLGMKKKILMMRKKNKQMEMKNDLLEKAIEERSKMKVLDNLRYNQKLSLEERIMSLQLQAEMFNKHFQERLLSAKKKDKFFQEPLHHNGWIDLEDSKSKNESQLLTVSSLVKQC